MANPFNKKNKQKQQKFRLQVQQSTNATTVSEKKGPRKPPHKVLKLYSHSFHSGDEEDDICRSSQGSPYSAFSATVMQHPTGIVLFCTFHSVCRMHPAFISAGLRALLHFSYHYLLPTLAAKLKLKIFMVEKQIREQRLEMEDRPGLVTSLMEESISNLEIQMANFQEDLMAVNAVAGASGLWDDEVVVVWCTGYSVAVLCYFDICLLVTVLLQRMSYK